MINHSLITEQLIMHLLPLEIWQDIASYLHDRTHMSFFHTCSTFLSWQPLKQVVMCIENFSDIENIPLSGYRLKIQVDRSCIFRPSSSKDECNCFACRLHRGIKIKLHSLNWQEIDYHNGEVSNMAWLKVECRNYVVSYGRSHDVRYVDCENLCIMSCYPMYFDFLKFKTLSIQSSHVRMEVRFLEINLDVFIENPSQYIHAQYVTFITNRNKMIKLSFRKWHMRAQKIRFIGNVCMHHMSDIPRCSESYRKDYDHFEWIKHCT